jgi:DNA-nicking Smr family endonuclease
MLCHANMTNDDDSKRSAARGTLVQPGVRAEARDRELAARKRVAALVSGGLHFSIKRQGDRIQATRTSSASKLVSRLSSKTFVPEQTIDLRGRPVAEIDGAISAFLRVVHRRGVKNVLVSFPGEADEPRELREESVIAALTRGSAAPLVRAFVSPHEVHGRTDTLAVLLV